jgi:hypothetical protein
MPEPVATDGDGHPGGTYAVFAPGDCDKPLPLNRITDVFRFSKFVGLLVAVQGYGSRRVVLPRTAIVPGVARTVAANPSATMLDVEGGVPLARRGELPALGASAAAEVAVDDVDRLLALREVMVNQRPTAVELTRRAAGELLAGRPAVVTARTDGAPALLRLVAPLRPGGTPAAAVLEITDLAGFLADPRVPGADGVPIPVTLTVEQVAGLRSAGRAELTVGTEQVTVTLPGRGAPALVPARDVGTVRPAGDVGVVRPLERSGDGQELTTTSGGRRSPVFELALHLPWTQTWTLLGYSRGVLLNTVSLAPQEETTIEIFTWDRRKAEAERTSSVESEDSFEGSDTTRITSDVMREAQNSYEFTFKGNGELGVDVEDVLHIGATVEDTTKQSFANTAKSTTGFLHESVTKSAGKVKQVRQTKVTESVESGREERVTRKLRNPNMCRTLNLDYFEVLAHYSIATDLDRAHVGLCVLVDNPLRVPLDRAALRVHEQALRRALLDRQLAPGFAAARLLEQRDQACRVACDRCHCSAPPQRAGGVDGLPEELVGQLTYVGALMGGLVVGNLEGLFDSLEIGYDQYFRNEASMQGDRRWVYDELLMLGAPGVRAALLSIFQSWQNKSAFSASQLDRLRFELEGVGGLDAILPTKLFGEHTAELERAIGNEYDAVFRLTSKNEAIKDEWLLTFVYATGLLDTFNDNGLRAALHQLIRLDDDWLAGQKDADAAASKAGEADGAATEAVRDAFGVEEVTETLERESALLAHLNLHAGYYRAELWKALTPATQLALLKPLLPEAVTPQAVGSFGDKLAFPVRLDAVPDAEQLIGDLVTDNTLLDELGRKDEVALPTPAVTLESRLGACDGCEEFVAKHRELDLAVAGERAKQEALETERYQKRLTHDPPVLDDPDPHQDQGAVRLVIRQEKDS